MDNGGMDISDYLCIINRNKRNGMKKVTIMLACCLAGLSAAAQTLDECQRAAAGNYPLVKKYDLIRQTTDLTVAGIGKDWLPRVSAEARATLQSDVPTLPDALTRMMAQQGIATRGLAKDQYRIGVDIRQTVYDGGQIKNRKDIARLQGEIQQAGNDVDMYALRKRVNDLYFGILLVDEQLALNADLQALLLASEERLAAMLKGGTAARSDLDNVRAERLGAVEQATLLAARRQTLTRMLALLTGLDIATPVRPEPLAPATDNRRPELRLIERRLQLADLEARSLDVALRPRLGLFAQGFYGYPGYDMFHDMMSRRFSPGGMVGVSLSWNIGALYTRKTDRARLLCQRADDENSREVFLFNRRLEVAEHDEHIAAYRRLTADDERIVALRRAVREAAESKLAHGIIDVTALLKEINAENAARLQRSTHGLELLKAMYDRSYTTGGE